MDELKTILAEDKFGYVSKENMVFILRFDVEMLTLGYSSSGKISEGFCWGKHMILYRKLGVKSETVYARIYIRDESIVLRLFLNQIDKHRSFIEQAPEHIKQVFTGARGDCEHCHNEKGGVCKFRKTYTLENRRIEKCNGIVFEFFDLQLDKLADYLGVFSEFFPLKRNNSPI